jgi:hypothetical protein
MHQQTAPTSTPTPDQPRPTRRGQTRPGRIPAGVARYGTAAAGITLGAGMHLLTTASHGAGLAAGGAALICIAVDDILRPGQARWTRWPARQSTATTVEVQDTTAVTA